MSEVGFAVVGVRNFAGSYLRNIEDLEAEGKMKLTAVVVNDQVNNADKVRELRHKGIAIYSSYENLLKEAKACFNSNSFRNGN